MDKPFAGLWGRLSKPNQSKYSLDEQIREGRQKAEQEGFFVLDSDIFIENGRTGTTLDRDELDRLKQRARTGKLKALYILNQDRVSRAEELDTWNLFRELKDCGMQIYSVEKGLIRVGDLVESLPMLLDAYAAHQEALKIKARASTARLDRTKAGKVSMPFGRYGYDYVDGELKINPDEHKVVMQIIDWYLSDEKPGFKVIADRLTKAGIATKRDKVGYGKKRDYAVWSYSAVADIIHDPIYMGVWVGNRIKRVGKTGRPKPASEHIPMKVPAFIDLATHEALEQRAKQAKRGVSQSTKAHSLMHGRIICVRCNGTFHPERSKWNTYVYKCPGVRAVHSHDGQSRTCHGGFSMREIDDLIWSELTEMLKNPETVIAGLQQVQAEREAQIKPDRDYLERCEAELAEMNQRRERISILYINGKHDKVWLDSQIDQIDGFRVALEGKIRVLKEHLAEAAVDAIAVSSIEQLCEQIREGIDTATFEKKREVIRLLNVSAVIHRGEKVRPGRKCRATGTITVYGYFPTVSREIGLDECQSKGSQQHGAALLDSIGSA